MENNILPEFQNYLRSKSLVNEKYIPYYAHWASKFMAFSNRHENLNHDLRVIKFLDHLKAQKNTADWQIVQAGEAVQLFIKHFSKGDKSGLYPGGAESKQRPDDVSHIFEELRQAIRIKHYAYNTEHTYIKCTQKFFAYISRERKKDINIANLNSDDVRNYLSYLALKERVSASTQNQALLKAVSGQQSAFS